MADNAPFYANGDLVSPLAMSLVMTYRVASGVTNVNKGDPVGISANVTDATTLATVVTDVTAGDAAVIGIAIDACNTNGVSTTSAAGVVPVLMHGITKVTLTAAAVTQGLPLSPSATQGALAATAAPTTAAILAGVVGYAITNFGSGDSGLIFVTK